MLGNRRIEVLREAKAEQEGTTDGNVRVPREVHIDLNRVRVHCPQQLGAAVERGCVERRLHDGIGHVAAYDYLLDQPTPDEVEGLDRLHRSRFFSTTAELRSELGRSDDRPGHKLGEEAQVQCEVQWRKR